MATPEKPSLDYSYTSFQQAQGDNSFPGTQLDNDLANLKKAADDTIDFVSGVIRSDGKLGQGVVTRSSLDETLLLGVSPPRPWATDTLYAKDDSVSVSNSLYICEIAHFSDDFEIDRASGHWAKLIEFTVPVTVAPDSVNTAALVNEAVTGPKIAPNAVSPVTHIADGSIPQAKLAADVAMIPIGGSVEWDGPTAPAGWLFKFGQTLSRTTYSALLTALTVSVTASLTVSSPTAASVSADLRGLGLEGAAVEGDGVPNGTTIVSVTIDTITLSANASSTGSGRALRVFPHGNGNGTTTFTLPDDRGRLVAGRDNMGGTAANRLTNAGTGNPGVDAAKLGTAGGADRVTLSSAQMPSHTHTGTTASSGAHTHKYNEAIAAVSFVGGSPATPLEGINANADTGTAGAHTHTFTTAATGSGQAHPNLPPVRVANKIIYAGVV